MADLKMIETFNGGDILLNGNDLCVINGFQNMPYLGMFGGNIFESTDEFNVNEQRFDFWGNELLMLNDYVIQFNSETERLFNEVALNSSGRLLIEQTITEDLKFMTEFSTVTVSASIISDDRIEINIKIQEPNNLESNEFTYIWDSTKQELSGGPCASGGGNGVALDYPLNFEL